MKTATTGLLSTVPRKPGETYPRLSVELVTPDERDLPWRIREAAAAKRMTLREWLLDAVREKLATTKESGKRPR